MPRRFRRAFRTRSGNGLWRLAGLPDVAVDDAELPPLPVNRTAQSPPAFSLAALVASPGAATAQPRRLGDPRSRFRAR